MQPPLRFLFLRAPIARAPTASDRPPTDTDITGDSVGIEIRNGSLNISGDSTITGGDKFEDPVPNGSGTTCQGVAVAVSQHSGSAKVNVNITGGTFKGAYGLYEVSLQGNEPVSEMSITGGTFESPVYSENVTDFISNLPKDTSITLFILRA